MNDEDEINFLVQLNVQILDVFKIMHQGLMKQNDLIRELIEVLKNKDEEPL